MIGYSMLLIFDVGSARKKVLRDVADTMICYLLLALAWIIVNHQNQALLNFAVFFSRHTVCLAFTFPILNRFVLVFLSILLFFFFLIKSNYIDLLETFLSRK